MVSAHRPPAGAGIQAPGTGAGRPVVASAQQQPDRPVPQPDHVPIHDRRGRVIAFGGRALGEDGPKYLNSAESPVFHKGRELYRLFNVRKGGLPERLLVVEGYMDAAALYQFGFEEAVATLGTAVTADHLELMFRATSLVVFCFDGDAAGRRAAWKGLEAALPVMRSDREVRFLFLPEGEDPDSLVRSDGAERFEQRLEKAAPLSG